MKKIAKAVGIIGLFIISVLGHFRFDSNHESKIDLKLINQAASADSEVTYYYLRCSNYNMYKECKVTASNGDPCYALSSCP
jgi:hypothetical protein